MKKAIPFILVVLMAVAVVVIKKCKEASRQNTGFSKEKTATSNEINRDRGFDRRISYLEYGNHAKCRMDCRHITQQEVEEIMQDGKINYTKSDLQNTRCPRYALEGITKDNQKVRIVFAQCNEKTEVVTVIDLETEWECHCPGENKNYDTRNR